MEEVILVDEANIGDIVEVIWGDAHTIGDRIVLKEILGTGLCESMCIGVLLDKTMERHALASHVELSDQEGLLKIQEVGFKDITFIPTSQIKELIVLRRKALSLEDDMNTWIPPKEKVNE